MRLTGQETFINQQSETPARVVDFWSWSQSDLRSNVLRGVLAEYIVALDIGLDSSSRVEWAAYDLITPEGITIEVKSAAYVQSWEQRKPSVIGFDISENTAWHEKEEFRSTEKKRHADCYVFCLLGTPEDKNPNALDLDQWRFWVLPTSVLNESCTSQKRISLNPLLRLNPIECR